jgi:hypothetical protein
VPAGRQRIHPAWSLRNGWIEDRKEGLSQSRQSVIPLLIALLAVLAVMYGLSPKPAALPHAEVPTSPGRRLGPDDIYPRADLTPGAANPDVTQENLAQTICNPRWSTKSIRPREEYTNRLKHEQIEEYHDTDTDPRDYEEDHLIPLEVGGNPNDPKNLWPEPYRTSMPDGGAKDKDKVENYLHDQVCLGRMPLADAQRAIATDWYKVYVSSLR